MGCINAKYKMMHRTHKGIKGCGGIAFYLIEYPGKHGRLRSENVIYPDGKMAKRDDKIECKACGGPIVLLTEDIEENGDACESG